MKAPKNYQGSDYRKQAAEFERRHGNLATPEAALRAKPTVAVGDRFEVEDSRPWRDGALRGTHYSKTIIEVTRVVAHLQAEYKTIQVLEESGRPRFGGDPLNVTGGFYLSLLNLNRFKAVRS